MQLHSLPYSRVPMLENSLVKKSIWRETYCIFGYHFSYHYLHHTSVHMLVDVKSCLQKHQLITGENQYLMVCTYTDKINISGVHNLVLYSYPNTLWPC